MSSLRRRAIWVTRARSIARSSTGGRASARTTAPASPGSTSSRSQASRSRTSARWKNAAAPDRWYGTARSSKATATAWPSARTERTSTQTSSGATLLARRSAARPRPRPPGPARARTRSARTRPRRRARPARATSVFSSRSSIGATTAPAAASSRAPARSDSSSRTTVASGHSARKSRMFLVAAPRKRWIDWSSSANALICAVLGHQQAQQQALGEARVLQLVDQHVARSGRPARARTCGFSRRSRKACRTRSPTSSAPASPSRPSWAANSAANSRSRAPRASSRSESAQAR